MSVKPPQDPEVSKEAAVNMKAQALSESFFKSPKQNCSKIGNACRNVLGKIGCVCCSKPNDVAAMFAEFERDTNQAIAQVYMTIREQEAKNKKSESSLKMIKDGKGEVPGKEADFDFESVPYLNLEAHKIDQEESTYNFKLEADFTFKTYDQPECNVNYTLSPRKNFLVVWNNNFISLYKLTDTKPIYYPTPNLKLSGSSMSNEIVNDPRAVFFNPREDRLVVICVDGVRIFDISLSKSNHKPVATINTQHIVKINHVVFLDSENNFGGSTSDFVNLNPFYLFLNMSKNPDYCYDEGDKTSGATFTCVIDISEETLQTTGEAELKFIDHDTDHFPNVGKKDNNQMYFYSSLQQGWFHVYIEEGTTKISFLEENLTSANDVRKTKITKQNTHNKKPINHTLFAKTDATESGLVLVSEPTKYIYALSFNTSDNMPLTEIITLPPRIRKINQITQDDELRFILLNTDDGDLYIFAKTRDGVYGLIYFNNVGTPQTIISLSPDLKYITLFSENNVRVVNFAPFDTQNKDVGPSAIKVSDILLNCVEPDAKVFNLLLDDYHCLKITKFNMVLYNIETDQENEFEYPDGYVRSELKALWPRDSTLGRWYVLLTVKPLVVNTASQGPNNNKGPTTYILIAIDLAYDQNTDEDTSTFDVVLHHEADEALQIARSSEEDNLTGDIVLFRAPSGEFTMFFPVDVDEDGDSENLPNKFETRTFRPPEAQALLQNFRLLKNGKYFCFWNPVAPGDAVVVQRADSEYDDSDYDESDEEEGSEGSRRRLRDVKVIIHDYPDFNDKTVYKTHVGTNGKVRLEEKPSSPDGGGIFTAPNSPDKNKIQTTEPDHSKPQPKPLPEDADDKHKNDYDCSFDDDADENTPEEDQFTKKHAPIIAYDEVHILDLTKCCVPTEDIRDKWDSDESDDEPLKKSEQDVNNKEIMPEKVSSFLIRKDISHISSSSKGRCLLIISPGLEIFFNIEKDSTKPPLYESKHRRYNKTYSLTRNGQFEFSEDENYLAVAFPQVGKSYLYDLTDPDNIKKLPLLKCPTYRNLDKIFEFVYHTDASGNRRTTYLAISDYSSSSFSNMIKVYELKTKVFLNGGKFSANLSPMRIRCHLDTKGRIDYVTSALVLMVKDRDKKLNFPTVKDKVWSCTTSLLSSQELPFYNVYRANLIRYMKAGLTSAAEQQFYLEQLINTYKVMKEEQIISNLKVSYTIFIFDMPGLFESIFTGRIGINMLFALHKMLYLSFAKDVDLRQNSLNSLANMFELSVKNKIYPKIDEDCIYTVIADQNENLSKSPGCRTIMSHIIFSDCHININALVTDKHRSGFVLTEAEAAQPKLSRSLVQKKCRDILVKRPKNTNDYRVYRSLVKLGLTNGSEASLGLFHSIQLMPDNEIRYKYRQLINYKWRLVYSISLVYTLIYFILNILAYVYFGFQSYYPFGIAIMALNVLFVAYDFKCFGSQWKTFLKDANNIVDLVVHFISFTAVFFIIFNILPNSHQFFKLVALAAVSLKGITLLKMFGALRMFIFLIGQILVDLMWVPFILALVLILSGTIYKVAPLPGGNINSNLTFFQSIEEVFYLIFMPSHANQSLVANRTDPSAILRSIIVVIGGTMIAQGIFNFIIAIFLQTFKRVNDDKEIFEIRSLILEIRYIDLFLRGFDRFFKSQDHYYVFLVPDPKDGVLYENETGLDQATKMFDNVMAEAANAQISKLEEKAIELLPGQKEEIKKVTAGVKQTKSPTDDPMIKGLVDMADRMAKGEKINVNQLKTAMSDIAKFAKPREKIVIVRAEQATKNFIQHTQELEKGTNSQKAVDQVLDFVASMIELMGPAYRSYGKKIKDLAPMIAAFIDSSKEKGDNKKKLKLFIPKFGDLLKNFSSADLGDNLTSMGDVLGEALAICEKVSQGEAMEIRVMVEKLTKMSRKILHKKEDQMKVPEELYKVIDLSVRISKIVCNEGRTGLSSPTFLVNLGGMVCKDFVDSNIHADIDMICKVVSLTLTRGIEAYKISAIDPKSKDLVLCLTAGVRDILGAVNPTYLKYVDPMIPIVTTLDSTIRDHVAGVPISFGKLTRCLGPILVEHLKVEADLVESILGVVDLVELQSRAIDKENSKEFQMDYAGLVRCAGKVLVFATKQKQLESHIETTAKAVLIIQASVISNKEKIDPVLLIQSVVDLGIIFKPEFAKEANQAMRGVRAIGRQVVNLQKGTNADLNSLVEDLGEVASAVTPGRFTPVVEKVKSVSGVILTSYLNLKVGKKPISSIVEAGGKIVAILSTDPNWIKFTDMAIEGSYLLEEVMSSRRGIKPVDMVKSVSAIALKISPGLKVQLDSLHKIVNDLHEVLTDKSAITAKNAMIKIDTFISVVKTHVQIAQFDKYKDFLSFAIPKIQSIAKQTENPKLINYSKLSQDVCELVLKMCELVNFDLKTHVNPQKIGRVVKMVEEAARATTEGSVDVDTIVNSVSGIAKEFDKSVGDILTKVGNQIYELNKMVSSFRDGEQADPKALIQATFTLIDELSPNTKSITAKISNTADTLIKEVQSYVDQSHNVQKLEDGGKKYIQYIQSAEKIISTLEPDLAKHVQKIEILIGSVENQIAKLSEKKTKNVSDLLESSKPLLLLMAPNADQALSKIVDSLVAAGSFVENVSCSMPHVSPTEISGFAEPFITLYPQLTVPINLVREAFDRLEVFNRNIENTENCVKASEFVSVIGVFVNSLAPQYKAGIDAGYEFMIAMEKVADGHNSTMKIDKMSTLAFTIIKHLSKHRPAYKDMADRMAKILDIIYNELPTEATDVHFKGVVDDELIDAETKLQDIKFEDMMKTLRTIITEIMKTISYNNSQGVLDSIDKAEASAQSFIEFFKGSSSQVRPREVAQMVTEMVKEWGPDQAVLAAKVYEGFRESEDKIDNFRSSEKTVLDGIIAAKTFVEVVDPGFSKSMDRVEGLAKSVEQILAELKIEDPPTPEDLENLSKTAEKLIQLIDPTLAYQATLITDSLKSVTETVMELRPQDTFEEFVDENGMIFEKIFNPFLQPRDLGIGMYATLKVIKAAMSLEKASKEDEDEYMHSIGSKVFDLANAIEPTFTLGKRMAELFQMLDKDCSVLNFDTLERMVVSMAKLTNSEVCNPETIHPFVELCTFARHLTAGAPKGAKLKLSTEDGQNLNIKVMTDGTVKVLNK